MRRYRYKAVSADGRLDVGTVDAPDSVDALQQLSARALTPVSLVEDRGAGAALAIQKGKVRSSDAVAVIRELATLTGSGVNLADALTTLRDSNDGSALYGLFDRMVQRILAGEEFSVALEAAGLEFPEYVLALVRAGEASGNLGFVLARAADSLEFEANMRAQAKEALIYPTILIVTGIGAILFVFSFVVPRFASLLRGRLDDLPWISEAVLRTGVFLSGNMMLSITGLLVCCSVAYAAFRDRRLRAVMLRAVARVPLIGEWVHSGETARWVATLAVLLESRVAILDALELAAASVRLPDYRSRLREVRVEVGRGKRLSAAIRSQRLLEATALSMVTVGERAGQLPSMLGHVAAYWTERNRSMQRKVVSLVEPVSILVIGLVIGFVMVGVVLAMASLTEVKL